MAGKFSLSATALLACLLSLSYATPQDEEIAREVDKSDIHKIRRYWGVDIGGPLALLKCPAVQDELGLTEEQARRIVDAGQVRSRDIATATVLARRGFTKESTSDAQDRISKRYRSEMLDLLDKDQRKRLEEIALQTMGPLAVAWPDVKDALQIGPGQDDYVTDILDAYNARKRELEAQLRSSTERLSKADDEETRKSIQERIGEIERGLFEAEGEAVKQISKLLSEAQKRRFNRRLGEPFDMSELLPPDGRPKPKKPEPAESASPDDHKTH